jgi:hypothetical protein
LNLERRPFLLLLQAQKVFFHDIVSDVDQWLSSFGGSSASLQQPNQRC